MNIAPSHNVWIENRQLLVSLLAGKGLTRRKLGSVHLLFCFGEDRRDCSFSTLPKEELADHWSTRRRVRVNARTAAALFKLYHDDGGSTFSVSKLTETPGMGVYWTSRLEALCASVLMERVSFRVLPHVSSHPLQLRLVLILTQLM